jgi:hypothetical protein
MDYGELVKAVKESAEGNVPVEVKSARGGRISEETMALLLERGRLRRENNYERDAEITKEIRKSRRRDIRRAILETLDKDLDLRSQWLGIRRLRKEYQPTPFSRRGKQGAHIPLDRRAEESALFLANEVWARRDKEGVSAAEVWPDTEYPRILEEGLGMEVGPITGGELAYAIWRLKRRKAPGPDGVPIELFKEMNEENRKEVLRILNEWWEGEEIPQEALRAKVVLLFQEGGLRGHE